jgi:metal-responsive CopG/Arc/MetJ family transcriptional regulator
MWSDRMATTRIEVYCDTELAQMIEQAAEERDMTESKWLKEAARQKLQRNELESDN